MSPPPAVTQFPCRDSRSHPRSCSLTHNGHFSQPRVTRGSFKLINGSLKQALSVREAPGRQCQPSGSRTASAGALCQHASSRAAGTASVAGSAEGQGQLLPGSPSLCQARGSTGTAQERSGPFPRQLTAAHPPCSTHRHSHGALRGTASSGNNPGNFPAELCPGVWHCGNVTRAAPLLTPALLWCFPSFGTAAKRE